MEFIAFFFIGFFLITIVLGPIFGAESRPEWLHLNENRVGPKIVDSPSMRLAREREGRL
jgi:hypothetical protein